MSFWKSLFGGGSASESEAQARRAGRIQRLHHPRRALQGRGAVPDRRHRSPRRSAACAKEHKFIRADRHASYDDAVEFSLAKARQIVDQQGERMFN